VCLHGVNCRDADKDAEKLDHYISPHTEGRPILRVPLDGLAFTIII